MCVFLVPAQALPISKYTETPSVGQKNALQGYSEGIEIVLGDTLLPVSSLEVRKFPVYGDIISCLIDRESGGNENAVGDKGKSFGILQFQKSTWQTYCVDKYNFLLEDYYKAEKQKECCEKMLNDDFRNIYHWSVASKCLK